MNKTNIKQLTKPLKRLIAQEWEESEEAWGTTPDGWTIHKSREELIKYIENHWKNMPEATPEIYSRPYRAPVLLEVSDDIYNTVMEKGSCRFYFNRSEIMKTLTRKDKLWANSGLAA